jgi:hypothetical protein
MLAKLKKSLTKLGEIFYPPFLIIYGAVTWNGRESKPRLKAGRLDGS